MEDARSVPVKTKKKLLNKIKSSALWSKKNPFIHSPGQSPASSIDSIHAAMTQLKVTSSAPASPKGIYLKVKIKQKKLLLNLYSVDQYYRHQLPLFQSRKRNLLSFPYHKLNRMLL